MKLFNKILTLLIVFTMFCSSSVLVCRANEIDPTAIPTATPTPTPEPPEPTPMPSSRTTDEPTLSPVIQKPKIVLLEPTNVVAIGGREKTFSLTIKNITSFYAYGVFTQVTPIGDAPFTVSFVDSTNYLTALAGNSSKSIDLKLNVSDTAKAGVYSIAILNTYRSNTDEDFETKSTLQVRIDNTIGNPNLSISNFSSSKDKILKGEAFTVKAILENNSAVPAKDVTISIDGLKSSEIFLQSSSNIFDFPTFGANASNEIKLNLISSSQIKPGSYPLTLKLLYLDDENKEYKKEYTYYVNISKDSIESDEKTEIQITKISNPTGEITVGSNFSMTLDVKNTSTQDAKNIKITALPAGEGAIVSKSSSIQQINLLKSGETKQLTYTFSPTYTSKSQNYTVGFTLEYETGLLKEDGTKEITTFTQHQGVNVRNYEADKLAQPTKDPKEESKEDKLEIPKIIIEKYVSNPIIVQAGKEFDLSMTFLNTNSTKTIQNVKVYLTAEESTEKKGNVFSPVNSSNTFFIDTIKPKGEVTKEFRFFTVPDANPKTYTLLVNFEYQDEKNNEYKSSEIVGINVKQLTKLDVGAINLPTEAFVNEQAFINFQFFNTGKVTLSNLMIKLTGDFQTENSSTYFGNFTASQQEYFEASIIPNKVGPLDGKIIISYEDDSGEKIEMPMDFSLNVMESNMGMNPNMIVGPNGELIDPNAIPPKKGFDIMSIVKNPYVYVGMAIVIVAVVFGVKKIKKKRSIDLNE